MLSKVTFTSGFYSPLSFLGLEISTATAEIGLIHGFVYIISVFTFESILVIITLYL
jgi:hypothetical protein